MNKQEIAQIRTLGNELRDFTFEQNAAFKNGRTDECSFSKIYTYKDIDENKYEDDMVSPFGETILECCLSTQRLKKRVFAFAVTTSLVQRSNSIPPDIWCGLSKDQQENFDDLEESTVEEVLTVHHSFETNRPGRLYSKTARSCVVYEEQIFSQSLDSVASSEKSKAVTIPAAESLYHAHKQFSNKLFVPERLAIEALQDETDRVLVGSEFEAIMRSNRIVRASDFCMVEDTVTSIRAAVQMIKRGYPKGGKGFTIKYVAPHNE